MSRSVAAVGEGDTRDDERRLCVQGGSSRVRFPPFSLGAQGAVPGGADLCGPALAIDGGIDVPPAVASVGGPADGSDDGRLGGGAEDGPGCGAGGVDGSGG